jgi:putative membrane protein
MLLMRTVVNALALLVTVSVVPGISFVDRRFGTLLLLAILLGVLNAFVKPVIQFATLRFIFATYGLVVALINAIILWLLALLLPNRLAVDSLFWVLIAGALIGIISALLENLLGLTPPIVSEKYPEVRQMIKERAVQPVEHYVARAQAGEEDQEQNIGQQSKGGQAAADAAAVLAVVGTGQEPTEGAQEQPVSAVKDSSLVAEDEPAAEEQEA